MLDCPNRKTNIFNQTQPFQAISLAVMTIPRSDGQPVSDVV